MKAPKTPMNNWTITKIVDHLTTKDGYSNPQIEYTLDGAKATLTDAFGFKYEVEVKMISRNYIPNEEITNEIPNTRNSLFFPKFDDSNSN
jgi:hypothetical protein